MTSGVSPEGPHSAPSLARDLEQAAERAAAVARELGAGASSAHAQEELGLLSQNAGALVRFIDDVHEALGQLFVAGVSFPDPDLPTEIDSLARRAERYGLPTAVEQLLSLRVEVDGLGLSDDLFVRADRSEALWRRVQRVTAWLRLFREQLELALAESRLVTEQGDPASVDRALSNGPTATLRCVPVGLLVQGRNLLVVALEEGTGAVVHWVDPLAEQTPRGPFDGLIISRFFREQVDLGQQLRSAVALTDHPYTVSDASDGVRVFGPAFSATPRAVGPTSNAPSVPAYAGLAARPGQVSLVITFTRSNGLALHTPAGKGPSVFLGRVLRCNALKLVIRRGSPRVPLDATLMRMGSHDHLIAAMTDVDGRVFPADDPSCFRLSRAELNRLIMADPSPGTAAVSLKTGGALFGAMTRSDLTRLRKDIPAVSGTASQRAVLSCLIRYLHPDSAPTEGELAASAERLTGCDPDAAAGLAEEACLGALITLAYGVSRGCPVTLDDPGMEALLTAGQTGETPKDAGWTQVCARTLIGVLARAAGRDDEPDPRAFVQAHLEALRRGRRGETSILHPDAMELLWLAWVFRVLDGVGADLPALVGAALPWADVALVALEAIARWRCEAPDAERTLMAAAALMVLQEADLGHLLVRADR